MSDKAKNLHDTLRHTQTAWGVPVRIVSYDDIEANAPDGLSRADTWQRDYDELTDGEKDFLAGIVDQYHLDASPEAPTDPEKRTFTRNVMARGIYTELRKSRLSGHGTSTTLTAPLMQDNFAPARGPDGYDERKAAIVIYRPNEDPQAHIAGLLGMATDDLNLPALDADEWNYFTLAHELSHAAGADEAQADRIATAQYIRAFGKDDVPKMWVTLRSLIAVQEALRGVAVEMAPQVLPPQALAQLGLDTPERRERKLANIRRYGWGPVNAIQQQVSLGADGNNALSEKDIHDIRFDVEDTASDRLFALARAVLDENPRMNPLRADLREIIPVLQKILPELRRKSAQNSNEIDTATCDMADDFLKQANTLLKPSPRRANFTPAPR